MRISKVIRQLVCFFLLLAFGAIGYAAPTDPHGEVKDISISTLFLTNAVFANARGEVFVIFFPDYVRGIHNNQNDYLAEINVGVTDQLTLTLDLPPYTNIRARDFEGANGEGFADTSIGAQYLFDSDHSCYEKAAGLFLTFPTGNINKGLTDGFIIYKPYFVVQRDMPTLNHLQIFSEFGFGLVQRVKEPSSGNLTPAAHSFIWNPGVYLPIEHFRYIAQFNFENNRWNHKGTTNNLFFSPGIIWMSGKMLEFGLSTPIGLNHSTDRYRIIGYVGIDFD